MIKSEIVNGTIYLKYKFEEEFTTKFDDDDIIDYIKTHYKEVINDDDAFEVDDVEIDDIRIEDYTPEPEEFEYEQEY